MITDSISLAFDALAQFHLEAILAGQIHLAITDIQKENLLLHDQELEPLTSHDILALEALRSEYPEDFAARFLTAAVNAVRATADGRHPARRKAMARTSLCILEEAIIADEWMLSEIARLWRPRYSSADEAMSDTGLPNCRTLSRSAAESLFRREFHKLQT